MLYLLTKKELQEVLRSGQFRIAGLIVLLLTVIAITISSAYYQSVQRQHEQASNNERNIWESQDDKNPHSAAHYGTYAFKPKYPLSLIDQGIDKFVGISIFLEAHARNEAQYMAAADQTGLARFGELTPDFILLFIIPLLVILIGHNTFTREKESGTLNLIKSQGVDMRSLALGKWIGVFLPVAMLTILVFLVAGVLLSSLSDFGELSWSSLLVMMLIYLVYYAIFTSITLLVSSLAKNSGLSLVSLLAFWIICCLAVPKAATNMAELQHPYPTKQAFDEAIAVDKSQGLDGHDPWNEAAKKLEEETLKAYKVSSVEELPFNYDGYRMQKGEEHEAEIYFKHYRHLKEIHQEQTGVYRNMAPFSPYLPVRFLSMSLAHTDYGTHWHFSDAAENYRIQLQKALNDNFAENSEYGDWAYKADKSLWSDIPEFSYEPPGMDQVLGQNKQNFAVLSGWLIIVMGGLFFSIKRL